MELKPCPFCGGHLFRWADAEHDLLEHSQNDCCLKGHCIRVADIDSWNTRPSPWHPGSEKPEKEGEFIGSRNGCVEVWRYDFIEGGWLRLDPDDQTFQRVFTPPDFWMSIPPLPEAP